MFDYPTKKDTVNVASRMESTSLPGCIQLSATLMSEIHALGGGYKVKSRGDVEIKGKGTMETFFLLGKQEVDERLVPPASAFETHGYHRSLSSDRNSASNLHSYASPTSLAPMEVKEQETPIKYYDVLVHLGVGDTKSKPQRLAGVASTSLLKDVMDTIKPPLAGQAPWRLYADESKIAMLLPTQTLGQLVTAGVVEPNVVRHNSANRHYKMVTEIILYAGSL